MEIIAACEELLHFCEKDYQKLNEKLKADLITALANLKASIRSSMAMINTNVEALGKHTPHNTNEDISAGREMLSRVDKLYERLGA
jgi:formiminotetrahydrofolate cyclodeaminase